MNAATDFRLFGMAELAHILTEQGIPATRFAHLDRWDRIVLIDEEKYEKKRLIANKKECMFELEDTIRIIGQLEKKKAALEEEVASIEAAIAAVPPVRKKRAIKSEQPPMKKQKKDKSLD